MVMEYIQNNYKLEKPNINNHSDTKLNNIEKYKEVLDKIEDVSSREKIKKEIDRF
jgi:hypothetical protein